MRVLAGLSGMLGAGVFLALGPAAAASGSWLPLGVLLAAVPALCALSSQRAVDRDPAADREWPDVLARGAGVAARLFAAAALAATAGLYLLPERPLLVAFGLLVLVPAAEWLLPALPVRLAGAAAGVVVAVLLVVVVSCFALAAPVNPVVPDLLPGADSAAGALVAAALLVVAFGAPRRTGYPVLVLAALLTGAVAVAALYQLGGGRLAVSPVPLADALAAAAGSPIDGLLRVGVLFAAALVLYHLIPDVRAELPVPGGRRAPAGLLVLLFGALLVTLLAPVAVLLGCAVAVLLSWLGTHLAALRLAGPLWPRLIAWLGLVSSVGGLVLLGPSALAAPLLAVVMLSTVLLALVAATAVRR